MKNFIAFVTRPSFRNWVYRVSVAAYPLLVLHEVMSEDAAPLWTALGGAILLAGTHPAKAEDNRPRLQYGVVDKSRLEPPTED